MTRQSRWQWRTAVGLVLLAALALLPRLRIVLSTPGVVEADESVFFLMASRIAQLRDAPIFFYGQPYLGSLNEYLAAAFMRLGGFSAASGRAASLALSVVLVVLSFRLGCLAAGRRAGWLAGAYAALAPTLLIIYGARLWAYIDIVVVGNVLFLHVLSRPATAVSDASARFKWWLVFGFLVGLGLWSHILFIVYLGTVLVFAAIRTARRERRTLSLASLTAPWLGGLIGFCVGGLPMLVFNLVHPGATLALFTRAAHTGVNPATRIASAVYNLAVVGFPSALGTLLPWRAFRTEMSVTLSSAGTALVGVALALALLGLAALAWAARQRSGAGAEGGGAHNHGGLKRSRLAALVALGFAAAFAVAVPWLAAWNGGPVNDLGMDPRVPYGSLALIASEMTTPAVLAILLWLPAALVVISRQRRLRHVTGPQAGAGDAAGLEHGDPDSPGAVNLLLIHVVVCCLAYALTSYGLARSPRFLLPLFSSLPVLFAVAAVELNLRFRHAGTVWAAGILAVNVAVQLAAPPELALQPPQYAGRLRVPRSYAELAGRLDALGYKHVYAPYWTGFPLVWASHERIAVSNGGEGKLPELDRSVAAATRVAFVFYRGKLDESFFRELLARARMPATVEEVGPFRVYCGVDVVDLRRSSLWSGVQATLSHP